MEIFSNEINHLGYILKLFASQKCIKSKHLQPALNVMLQNPAASGVVQMACQQGNGPTNGSRWWPWVPSDPAEVQASAQRM